MKKWGSLLLAALLCFGGGAQALAETAERTEEQRYEEVIVGTATALTGQFFTSQFGNNTADIDVRELLHGYHLVKWNGPDCIFAIDQSVVSGLVSVAGKDGSKQYIIALAEDLKFSDGTPITAKDYVFSILLSASHEMGLLGGMPTNLDYISGAKAYAAGEETKLAGVRLLGDRRFSITIDAQYLPFFFEMGWLDFCPYPISVIAPGCEVADDGEGAYLRNIDPEVKEPLFTEALLRKTVLDPETGYLSHPSVTSGPYRLTAYDPEAKRAEFAVNPNYKENIQGKTPSIPRIVFAYVDPAAMIEEMNAGRVDLLNKCVQADMVQEGLKLAGARVAVGSNYPRSGLSFISFACEKGPAQFESVRQALALCLDRDQFVTDTVRNFGMKVNGYYGMGQWMQQLVSGTLAPPEGEPGAGAAAQDAVTAWESLTLENLDPYDLDVSRAKNLLVQDGWTLNEAGEKFKAGTDAVRAREVDGQLMPLRLSLLVTEGSGAEEKLAGWQENLATLGIALTIEAAPYETLLRRYYRQEERKNDMFMIASNFMTLYDPSGTYSVLDENQGVLNTTGLRDQTLMNLALDMRRTEPGDLLSYCQKWVSFQEYWNKLLPMIPLYSNTYFDFSVPRLRGYVINENVTWANAICDAYLSDALETEDEAMDAGPGMEEPLAGPAGSQPLGAQEVILE